MKLRRIWMLFFRIYCALGVGSFCERRDIAREEPHLI